MINWSIVIISNTIILLKLPPDSSQRCCLMSDPTFETSLIVKNVSPGLVSVSWAESLARKECADEFEIYYWKSNSERKDNQKTSSKQEDGKVEIRVSSKTLYTFQVKAKEICMIYSPETWSPQVSIRTIDNGKLICFGI